MSARPKHVAQVPMKIRVYRNHARVLLRTEIDLFVVVQIFSLEFKLDFHDYWTVSLDVI